MPPKHKIMPTALPERITGKALVTTVAASTEEATATVETTRTTVDQINQGMEKTMKTAEDFLAFGQSNMDAFVKSGQIWAAGMQDLSKQVAATAQASFDESMAAFKALSGLKNPKDAMDMQANLVRSNMEKVVAETGKITDASMKLAEQAIAPLTAQMNAVVEKFAKVA